MTQEWRASPDYRNWQSGVVDRDGRCQSCGTLDNLHAHHIKHATYWPELRFELDNGIALCSGCHMTFHNDYIGSTRKRCNDKDLSEYLRIRNHFAKKFLAEHIHQALFSAVNT